MVSKSFQRTYLVNLSQLSNYIYFSFNSLSYKIGFKMKIKRSCYISFFFLQIYMYGGTMRSGHVSRELWALDLKNFIWERVETSQGQCMASEVAKLCGPINSMGHTAHVVTNRMIVIFGHSPKYGYLDTVQECKSKSARTVLQV